MFDMRNKPVAILCVLLWCILAMDKSETQNTVSALASAVEDTGNLDQDPNPVVEALAQSISNGLQNREVLGDFADFVIYQPYDLFFKIAVSLLVRAGINDTALAKVVADAVAEVGAIPSKVYFDFDSYTLANVLFDKGIATINNVEDLSLSFVSAIGVRASKDGLTDIESVMHAVEFGSFDVLESYGLINYDNMVYIFYRSAEDIVTIGSEE